MRNKKVAVAMSGGVDSSLTAALLLERGFEVVGVTMLLSESGGERSCCSSSEVEDARAVCQHLEIRHYVADFREIFRDKVENYFVAEYLSGRTPNPCVRCNREIKFGRLFEFAQDLGADYLATGHYARIIFEEGRFKLKKAVDERKDQSYVLYNLTAEKLSRILLPLGEFSKSETRRLAEEKNLPVAHKPDSQEICFVPNNDYKKFISSRCRGAQALKSGNIVDASGKILGHHNGIANYTIGQRKGLGISNPTPLYVTRLDALKRRVIVGSNSELFSDDLRAENVQWIYKPQNPATLGAKIRYGAKISACEVFEEGNLLRVKFFEAQRAITAGQSIVFYAGEEVLGGGTII